MRSETWIVREPPRKLTDRIWVQQRVPEIDWRLDLIIIRALSPTQIVDSKPTQIAHSSQHR